MKKGIVGLIPLSILLGYFTGNGLALTSGGRFLQPVLWVLLFYISIGLFAKHQILLPDDDDDNGNVKLTENKNASPTAKNYSKKFSRYAFSLLAVLTMALIIPTIQYTQQPKPRWFPDTTIRRYVKNHFPVSETIIKEELVQFLENPNIVITEGFAYHPKIYNSPLFIKNKTVFELTTLTDNEVYISTLFNPKNIMEFQEGSRVIIVGCSTQEEDYWGVKTNVIRTLAVFQLTHQKQVYVNPGYNMECNQ